MFIIQSSPVNYQVSTDVILSPALNVTCLECKRKTTHNMCSINKVVRVHLFRLALGGIENGGFDYISVVYFGFYFISMCFTVIVLWATTSPVLLPLSSCPKFNTSFIWRFPHIKH